MILEKGLLSFYSFGEGHLLCDLLLTPALDDHVTLLQLDDLIVDYFHHILFCAFVNQVRFG